MPTPSDSLGKFSATLLPRNQHFTPAPPSMEFYPEQHRRQRLQHRGPVFLDPDDEMVNNWNNNWTHRSPIHESLRGTLSELQQARRLVDSPLKSLQILCRDTILHNQNFYCEVPQISVGNLSPMMQCFILRALPSNMSSPVYYHFLTTLLNKNTWIFDDAVVPMIMNSKAIFQLLVLKCPNLKELYLHFCDELATALDSPSLDNLTVLHCRSFHLNDEMLIQISRLKHLRNLNLRLGEEVTEKGIASLSKLNLLDTFHFYMSDNLSHNGTHERVAIMLFQHIPNANITYSEDKFRTISYALFNYLEQTSVKKPLGQRAIRLVEKTDFYDQLPQILPHLETMYVDNMFFEITLANLSSLLQFENLCEVHLSDINIEMCHQIFVKYGRKLLKVFVENCDFDFSEHLDASLLFNHCPNLRIFQARAKFSQTLRFPLLQASFDALWVANIHECENYPLPNEVYEKILRGKQLMNFFTNSCYILKADMSGAEFKNLGSMSFLVNSSNIIDAQADKEKLVSILFLAKKLTYLTICFESFVAKQVFNPIRNMCREVAHLEVSFL